MQQNNVISFPREYKGPADLEKITENLEMMKHFHIQETISYLAPMIFTQLDIAGFSFDDSESAESEQSLKEGAFVVESLRALMCRYYGIYHPFQDISDKVFEVEDIEVPSLKIVDSIDIKFHKTEKDED
jgi:hypothetical protein